MACTVISERSAILIRRQVLNPGEATLWRTDLCGRFTVVMRGEQIAIEFRESGDRIPAPVYPSLAEWDTPLLKVHRAINTGSVPYEEVVIYNRDRTGTDPAPGQP